MKKPIELCDGCRVGFRWNDREGEEPILFHGRIYRSTIEIHGSGSATVTLQLEKMGIAKPGPKPEIEDPREVPF